MTADPDGASATHRKALELNLDPTSYGTFAEIGAGQEVANWFLRVGAASGTVAQTICAYDKEFSDERYGQGTRYVSRERLLAMLDREFQPLEGQLRAARGPQLRFFAFADTVAARNFKGDNEQHGWVGIRFQRESGVAPSDVLLHVELRDRDVALQREALGVLGVNLVHAAFHQRLEPQPFLRATFEDLTTDRLEVDVIELRGSCICRQRQPSVVPGGAPARYLSWARLRRGRAPEPALDGAAQARARRRQPRECGGDRQSSESHLRGLRSAEAGGGTLERDPITVLDLRLA